MCLAGLGVRGVAQLWEGETLLIATGAAGDGGGYLASLAWPGQLKGPERALLEIERGSGVGLSFTGPRLGWAHTPTTATDPSWPRRIGGILRCQFLPVTLRRDRFLG